MNQPELLRHGKAAALNCQVLRGRDGRGRVSGLAAAGPLPPDSDLHRPGLCWAMLRWTHDRHTAWPSPPGECQLAVTSWWLGTVCTHALHFACMI